MSIHYEREMAYVQQPRITWAVQRLILANTVLFAGQLLLDIPFGLPVRLSGFGAPPGGNLIDLLAFQPDRLLVGMVWKPLTYMFLHNDLTHLFFNMLWLFFFGPEVERVLGTRQFIRFYLICGALGVLATFISYNVSVTGASGAVMGVMIAFAMINPDRQFFLFPLPIPITARALVIIIVAMNILMGVQGGGATSVSTHLGGMAVGYGYMKLIPLLRERQRSFWRKKYDGNNPSDPLGEAVDNIFKFEEEKRKRGER